MSLAASRGTAQKTAQEVQFAKPGQIKKPLLMIEGWYDIYVDQMIDFFQSVKAGGGDLASQHSRLLIGPWTHGTGRPQSGDLEFEDAAQEDMVHALAFFDYWLRGEKAALDENAPAIQYYQMGTNQWRHTETWPPPGMQRSCPLDNLQPGRSRCRRVAWSSLRQRRRSRTGCRRAS